MVSFSNQLRQEDTDRLYRRIVPHAEPNGNWIVQGLPSCGVEHVFARVCRKLQDAQIPLFEIKLRNFWTGPVSAIVQALLQHTALNASSAQVQSAANPESLSALLYRFRESIHKLTEQGKPIVIVLDTLDALLKFSEPDAVQQMLNTFQSIGASETYHTVFLVSCYRDIEDICQRVNYSDFYKIFGTNHYRVRGAPYESLLAKIREFYTEWADPLAQEVAALSGGYAEHVEVIARSVEADAKRMRQDSLDALATVFDEWIDCLTPGEESVLHLVSRQGTVGPEQLFDKNKLLRKGILVDVEGVPHLTSPLFGTYLAERVGSIAQGQQPFLRASGNLPDVHQQLLARLFGGRYYIEWEFLQRPSPENATVYMIRGEDARAIPYRPCIVKVDRAERLDEEIEKTQQAKTLLGPLVPSIIACEEWKGQKAVLSELATGDNRDFRVDQFQSFYRDHQAEDVERLLLRLFTQALFPLYRTQKTAERKHRKYYYLPRFLQGEYQLIEEQCRRSRFHNPDSDMLQIPGLSRDVPNPGVYLRPSPEDQACAFYQLFEENHPIGLCQSHGDLNPRNLLIDGIENMYLIDFTEMKDVERGCRFLDTVRLEAEIKFKLAALKTQDLDAYVALDQLLTAAQTRAELERIRHLPLDSNSRKMVISVCALRESARRICTEPYNEESIDYEYKLGLLAQTLRIALFTDYLDEAQQEFAVVSAAMLANWLIEMKPPLS